MNLSKNGDFMPYRVNRLVALTYLPNPHNYPIVRHLDNNKLNTMYLTSSGVLIKPTANKLTMMVYVQELINREKRQENYD